MRLDRERLHVLARDAPLLGDHLGPPELRDLLVAVAREPPLRSGERVVVKPSVPRATVIADAIGIMRHVLDAAGDDHVVRAGHHGLRREVQRLLGRPALAVDRDAGHLLGKSGGEPARPGDVAGLGADGVDATEEHVLDRGRVDVGALDQRLQHVGAEVGRVHVGQTAAALADGRPDGVDDEYASVIALVTITDDPWPNSPWLIVRPTFAPST